MPTLERIAHQERQKHNEDLIRRLFLEDATDLRILFALRTIDRNGPFRPIDFKRMFKTSRVTQDKWWHYSKRYTNLVITDGKNKTWYEMTHAAKLKLNNFEYGSI
jgi:hypothetical protein